MSDDALLQDAGGAVHQHGVGAVVALVQADVVADHRAKPRAESSDKINAANRRSPDGNRQPFLTILTFGCNVNRDN